MREQHLKFGVEAHKLPHGLQIDAVKAAAILEPYGVSLAHAAAHFSEWRDGQAKSIEFAELFKLYLRERDLAESTYRDYRQTGNRLERHLGGKLICDIDAKLTRVREVGPSSKVDSPELAYAYWQEVIRKADWFQENKEHLVILLLNTRHNIEGHSLVSIGTLNESLAHPREIFSPAVAGGAYAFILMHNHPSGDPSPSQADRQLTKRIAECAEVLGIRMLDHVITGTKLGDSEPYFSFREMGLL